MRDGIVVTKLRGAFVLAVYRAAVAHLTGGTPETGLRESDELLEAARSVVNHRRENLHDPAGEQWIAPSWNNPTIYRTDACEAMNVFLAERTAKWPICWLTPR